MGKLEVLFTLNLFGLQIPVVKTMVGVFIELLLLLIIGLFLFIKKGTVKIVFEMFYEFMYNFFEEILGKKERKRIKGTITTIFFVVFFANMLGWLGDILAQGIAPMEKRFAPFSAGINGVVAMSFLIVVFTIIIQIINIGGLKTIYEYFPIWGKGFLKAGGGDKPKGIMSYIGAFFIKTFDIVISLFVGILDIIGTGAKVISLAFRLYGNMLAGTVLLGLLVGASGSLTKYLIGFEFPVLFPIILFIQGLLVACIQAFVVALLTSIFVKMFQVEEDTEKQTT